MILLCGIPTESPLALVRARLEALRLPHRVVSQRGCLSSEIEFSIGGSAAAGCEVGAEGLSRGSLRMDGESIALEECTGIYLRLMDDAALPELSQEAPQSPLRLRARAWHEALNTWCEVTPRRVINRSSAMGSNASKPYQAQIIMAQGLLTPETLVTSDPEAVAEFRRVHGRVIFKSMSGARSIVKELEEEDLARLESIRWCPVQFQAFVPGRNVRVHVVGHEIFATAIDSAAVDYRYAGRQSGEPAQLRPTTIDDDCAEHCIALAAALGLPFAGIDLKITPEGEVYCFEVNPSPGYSYYETNTGQEISLALALHLAGDGPH
jgi:hypothetical protein